jgi:hypothetical protein
MVEGQSPAPAVRDPATDPKRSTSKRRRNAWLTVIALVAAIVITGSVVLSQSPSGFWQKALAATTKAEVSALVSVAPSSCVLDEPVSELAKRDATDLDRSLQDYITLLKSPLVLNAAMRDTKMSELRQQFINDQKDPIAWLENNLQAHRLGNSGLIRVSMSGTDRPMLITVVDAVTRAFIRVEQDQAQDVQLRRLNELERILSRREDEYSKKLEKYQQSERLAEGFGLRATLAREDLTGYLAEARRLAFARNGAQVRLQLLTERPDADKKDVARLQSEIAQLTGEQKQINRDIEQRAAEAGHKSVQLTMMKQELDTENRMIERLRRLKSELRVRIETHKPGVQILQGAQ